MNAEKEIHFNIDQKEKIQSAILSFLDNSDEENDDYEIQNLINFLELSKIYNTLDDLKQFLQLFLKIINHHHRQKMFCSKITKILLFLKDKIKESFNNTDIFNMFLKNKLILLLLIKNEIITLDEQIFRLIIQKNDENGNIFGIYFYPEIKKFMNIDEQKAIEEEIANNDLDILDNFEEKRLIAENESYICSLIRNDSIDEFVSYVNRKNISLESTVISTSIFETNPFLIKNETTLIEYASFFESIRIFNYLRLNNVTLKPSLWLYAIHSGSPELFNLLIENHIELPQGSFEQCLLEAIKCHHNDIAIYIQEYLIDKMSIGEQLVECTLHYHNYSFFNEIMNHCDTFFYLCQYNYKDLFNLYLDINMPRFKVNNDIPLRKVAEEIQIDILYYQLLNQNQIENELFMNIENLTKIVIPQSITKIGIRSFSKCTALTKIIIPSSVTCIEKSAFEYCTSLKKIIIPSSCTHIGESAFCKCSSLSKVSILSSLKSIEESVFDGCTSLTQISIPSSVTTIEKYAFYGCSSLQKIKIPSSVTSISDSSFCACSSLKYVPNLLSITYIGRSTFYGCASLEEITIPSSVKYIGKCAFSICSMLKHVSIPSSVTKIYDYAFYACKSLNKINIPPSVISIGSFAFGECTFLRKVIFSNHSFLQSIGRQAFLRCSSLSDISIPFSVVKIGDNAFKDCVSLTQISLPPSIDLKQIGINYDLRMKGIFKKFMSIFSK